MSEPCELSNHLLCHPENASDNSTILLGLFLRVKGKGRYYVALVLCHATSFKVDRVLFFLTDKSKRQREIG